MKKTSMAYMKGYSNGYKPPSGSAGSSAFGEYSHKSNPLSVPKKGSQIAAGAGGEGYMNSDRNKAMRLSKDQERNENLRGLGC